MPEVELEQQEAAKKNFNASSILKLALEFGPLVAFFGAYAWAKGDAAHAGAGDVTRIIYATIALMIATTVSLVASWLLLKRAPIMPLVTGVFVLIFGGLTIYLRDPTFIKIKPTIVNMLFAIILAAGLFLRRPLLKFALGEILQMREEGWRLLTLRWIGFFVFLAILNETIWRNFSEETWVSFKTFGMMPLTFFFMMSQITLIMRYQISEVPSEASEAPSS